MGWKEQYLSVLGVDSGCDLAELQMKHLRKIPFQNVEGIRNGQSYFNFENPNSLLEPVLQGVGGICFHLNYSFHLLLKEMGYKCHLISCRLRESDFDHMAIAVEEDGQLKLVDVGMGTHYITKPMLIEDGHIHQDVSGTFRMRREGDRFVVERWRRRRWVYIYSFLLTPRQPKEFEYMVVRHYKFDSNLRENIICSRWIGNRTLARLYNKRLTFYRGENNLDIKMEGLTMENVLKWGWLTDILGILVMMGDSEDDKKKNDDGKDSGGSNDDDKGGSSKKSSPCNCDNPDLTYETKKGRYGNESYLVCRNCDWSSSYYKGGW